MHNRLFAYGLCIILYGQGFQCLPEESWITSFTTLIAQLVVDFSLVLSTLFFGKTLQKHGLMQLFILILLCFFGMS